MDNLKIESGVKRIAINNDPERVIEFNPRDARFAEKFFALYESIRAKLDEYQKRGAELQAQSNPDENDVPANMPEHLKLLTEACGYFREQIDLLFGAGTSRMAFGDALEMEMYIQFFEGITPFVKSARSEKMAPYLNPVPPVKRKHNRKHG